MKSFWMVAFGAVSIGFGVGIASNPQAGLLVGIGVLIFATGLIAERNGF